MKKIFSVFDLIFFVLVTTFVAAYFVVVIQRPTYSAAQPLVSELQIEGKIILTVPGMYQADFDIDRGCVEHLSCTVTKWDVEDIVDDDAERNWWVPKRLSSICVPAEAYTGTGFDRGHIRALHWSRRRKNWCDVNCMAVIVPEYPEVNRITIRGLEDHVCELATESGKVDVEFWSYYDSEMEVIQTASFGRLCVPSEFRYRLTISAGDKTRIEQYWIPNTPHPNHDFRVYRFDGVVQ